MPKTKPVTTKRGQYHRYKSFWIKLVKDINITKIDPNFIRNHPDLFEKKKVQFEKRNSDPVYFRQTVCKEFQKLSDGVEFSFWRLSKNNTTLIPLPPEINNAASLCNFEELNRSHLYIKLQAIPPSMPFSSSSNEPQPNQQLPDLIDTAGQQTDNSSIPLETIALHEVTDLPGNDDGKKQMLGIWNVKHTMETDGELLIEPISAASAALASISTKTTASRVKKAVMHNKYAIDMSTRKKTSEDISRGNALSSSMPKKRKITLEPDREAIAAKRHQSSSVQENDLCNEAIDVNKSGFYQHDYTNNLSTTVLVNNSCPLANTMDYNSGVVTGQLITFTDGQLDQLVSDNGEYSSLYSNFNYLGTGYQLNSCQQSSASATIPVYALPTAEFAMPQIYTSNPGNSKWISVPVNQDMLAGSVSNPMNAPDLRSFTDSLSVAMPNTLQFPPKQRTSMNSDCLGSQLLGSHMTSMQQPSCQVEMVSQNTSGSGITSVEDDTDGSNLPHAKLIGRIQPEQLNHIKDLAVINGKIYIIYEAKETLLVYSINPPFRKEKRIQVIGMKHPRSISAYAEKNCLFVSDGDSESSVCIWRVEGGDEVVIEKFVEDVKCRSLSVTSNGELLTVDVENNCIHLYGSDGRCFRCVRLPVSIEYGEPQFAVKSLTDNFFLSTVMSTRSDTKKNRLGMIYKISKDKDVLKTFNGRAGHGSRQLNGTRIPLALNKYGRVIAGDEGNQRILLLDSNLQLLTVVLNKDDLREVFTFGRGLYTDWSLYFDANFIFCKLEWEYDLIFFGLSQFQPNSACSVFSRTTSDTGEFHLVCSFDISSYELEEEIRGVATLTDSLYVLTDTLIKVYECTNSYKFKYGEFLGHDLWDIAANVSDWRLYVTDKSEQCVWSLGIDLRKKKWLEGIGSPYTVSVAKDGSVVIPSYKDQSLDIYDKDGHRLQRIRLSCDRKLFLRHAVKLSSSRGNETYLVCHGVNLKQDAFADDDCHRDVSGEVLVVSSTGDVIQSVGSTFSNMTDQLNLPSHMFLDRDNTLLIADCRNNRILRLDHQLKLQNIPLNMKEPFRLCYDESNGQIIVANTNSVDIFVHGNNIRCKSQDECFSSDEVAETEEPEPVMPSVKMFGQVDIPMLKDNLCRGAAVLQDHLYLIYECVNTVFVHSSYPSYTKLNQIVIEEMKNPSCIVASVEHDCVYIADKREKTVWRLLGNGQESQIFLGDIKSLQSISVTEEGDLFLLSAFCFAYYTVRTYDEKARCIQNIEVSHDVEPNYAVKLRAAKFLVHARLMCNDSCKALIEVSLDGVILHSYGPFVSTYFECGGMAVGEGNQIFVIDKAKGGRILMFGPSARLIGVLLCKDDHQITELTGLSYIKEKKQLLVIGSHQIVMYQLSQNRGPKMDGHKRKRTTGVENPVLCSRQESSGQLLFSTMVTDDEILSVRGVAKLKDELYLLTDNSLLFFSPRNIKEFRFDNTMLSIREGRPVDAVGSLWDIAANETDHCLYVTDRPNHCVWSVTIDHKITKWLTNIGSPYTLSVTGDGCLCILSNVYKSLDIYDRSGTREKSIRLPPYMDYLLHAVQSSAGTYVVSWTRKRPQLAIDSDDRNDENDADENDVDENDPDENDADENDADENDADENDADENDADVVFEETHRNCRCKEDSEIQKAGLVCEVSSDGNILRSFGTHDQQPNQIDSSDSGCLFQLEIPCHLAIDHDGRIFVADYHRSNRVLLLDSQLNFLANLTENFAEEDNKPRRLCYDRQTKELFLIEQKRESWGDMIII